MLIHRILFAICASLIGPATAVAAPIVSADEQRALEQVRLYSEAYMRRDIDTLVSLSHPIFAIRMGGEDKYRASIASQFQRLKELGVDLQRGEEVLGTPSEELVLGRARMIGVPAVSKTPGAATTPFVYVAVSYDEGKTWTIVNLACTDEKWLRALVPGYQGSPDILGLGNPAVSKMLTESTFDEDTFLRGPKYGRVTLTGESSVAKKSRD